MEEYKNETQESPTESQKLLRKIAFGFFGVATLPLIGAMLALSGSEQPPEGTSWLVYYQTPALLLGLVFVLDAIGGMLIILSLKPDQAENLARHLRKFLR